MPPQDYVYFYRQFIWDKVDEYVNQLHPNKEYVVCAFYIYEKDSKRNKRICGRYEKKSLDIDTYKELLSIWLKHPDMRFRDLPYFAPRNLCKTLYHCIGYPNRTCIFNADRSAHTAKPMAVEMVSLWRDVKAIAGGENVYYCSPRICNNEDLYSQYVVIWMKQIEITTYCHYKDHLVCAKFGMIDVESVREVLGIKTNNGIEAALTRICTGQGGQEADPSIYNQRLAKWLDMHNIKYVYDEKELLPF